MTRTQLLALTTQTSATDNTGVDVSGITNDWTLVLEVQALIGTARLQFTDSVDNFSSDKLAGPTTALTGTLTNSAPRRFTWTKKDFPDFRPGVTSAKVRLSLTAITASTGTITYESWIEN